MLRVFLKKHDFDPDMLIRAMLIKKKRVPLRNESFTVSVSCRYREFIFIEKTKFIIFYNL